MAVFSGSDALVAARAACGDTPFAGAGLRPAFSWPRRRARPAAPGVVGRARRGTAGAVRRQCRAGPGGGAGLPAPSAAGCHVAVHVRTGARRPGPANRHRAHRGLGGVVRRPLGLVAGPGAPRQLAGSAPEQPSAAVPDREAGSLPRRGGPAAPRRSADRRAAAAGRVRRHPRAVRALAAGQAHARSDAGAGLPSSVRRLALRRGPGRARSCEWCRGARVSACRAARASPAYHRADLAAAHPVQGGQPRLLLRPLGLRATTTSSPSSTATTCPRRPTWPRWCGRSPTARSATSPRPASATPTPRASWAARGRLHREATLHGPVQLGHNGGLAPVCIGSHYAVRTRALREIGGLGPELAEDFSTTLPADLGRLARRVRHRRGGPRRRPADVRRHADAGVPVVAQPDHAAATTCCRTTCGRLAVALRLRFRYALAYYPLLALTTLAGLALPPVAAVTGAALGRTSTTWSSSRTGGRCRSGSCSLALLLRRRGLLRPRGRADPQLGELRCSR